MIRLTVGLADSHKEVARGHGIEEGQSRLWNRAVRPTKDGGQVAQDNRSADREVSDKKKGR
ncbi:MAG: hypothetical protein ACR2HJ_04815 [Fimbriimonadales bacterium]